MTTELRSEYARLLKDIEYEENRIQEEHGNERRIYTIREQHNIISEYLKQIEESENQVEREWYEYKIRDMEGIFRQQPELIKKLDALQTLHSQLNKIGDIVPK